MGSLTQTIIQVDMKLFIVQIEEHWNWKNNTRAVWEFNQLFLYSPSNLRRTKMATHVFKYIDRFWLVQLSHIVTILFTMETSTSDRISLGTNLFL